MHGTTLLSSIALLSTTAWAGYSLQDDYGSGSEFLSKFQFFTGADPTDGFVEYLDQSAAQQAGLISYPSGGTQFGADSKETTTTGRKSVRLTSNAVYNTGLVILDLAHMPSSACGSWPAFWMVGPNWPNEGEIDIIEGVNDQSYNAMTLHTGDSCSVSNSAMIGSLFTNNCDVSGVSNTGCSIHAPSSNSYGTGFNTNNGGTYATEWTDSAISIFFWPHGTEPADVSSGWPNPSSWGEPVAKFAGSGCNYANSFKNQQIVFDITFCGQWAGTVWPGSTCASQNNGVTCDAFVGNNPSAFAQSYWNVRSLKVYQDNGGAAEPTTSPIAGGPTSTAGWGVTPTATAAATHKHGPGHGKGHGTGHGTGHGHHGHKTQSTFAFSTRTTSPAVVSPATTAVIPTAAHTTETHASSFWQPNHTWKKNVPQQSGGWSERDNGDGTFAFESPDVVSAVKEKRAQATGGGNSSRPEEAVGQHEGEVDVDAGDFLVRVGRHLRHHRSSHGRRRL